MAVVALARGSLVGMKRRIYVLYLVSLDFLVMTQKLSLKRELVPVEVVPMVVREILWR